MSEEQYHSASHCKYLIQYHIIWCPKFRFSVLQGNVDIILKQILQKICNDYKYKIKELEVMPDHIHIFIDVPQTVPPCDVVRTLKSISAIELLTHGLFSFCILIYIFNLCICQVKCSFHPTRKRVGFRHKFITNPTYIITQVGFLFLPSKW